MKKYFVEFLSDGKNYTIKSFTDFTMAMNFYSQIKEKEWARMS